MTFKDWVTQQRVRRLYRRINFAKANLEIIRNFCPHNEIEVVDYSPREGMVLEQSKVCAICGEFIDYEGITMANASVN